jgi:hypothetical protein
MRTRRQFHYAAAQLVAAAAGLAQTRASTENLHGQIKTSLTAASEFLAASQEADGAWRSTIYGPLKDGPSLTSHIAATLAACQVEKSYEILQRARKYLVDLIAADGHFAPGASVTYPVYTAAGAIMALSQSANQRHAKPRAAWITLLRSHQLGAQLGWQPADPAYGGWSYAHEPPSPILGKPASPLAEPNLSATVFAIDGLQTAGSADTDPAFQAAKRFVQHCQNWITDPQRRDPRFDDGGFCFVLNDPVRNKAGKAGADDDGHMRYKSYGSATADGLRALLACGVASDHPRVVAARRWLVDHFSAESHPGDYPEDRGHLREAVFYYYTSSIAQAFSALTAQAHDSADLPPAWPERLATALLSRQNTDGFWTNPAVDTREDDPLVATPLAMRALLTCQRALEQP